MNKRPTGVIQKFKLFEVGEVGISIITVSELQYGAAKSAQRRLSQQRLEEFLSPIEILTYDEAAAKIYGEIRLQLEKLDQPIGPLDLLIAAHALSRNLIVVTNNESEFKRIKGLKVENWAKY